MAVSASAPASLLEGAAGAQYDIVIVGSGPGGLSAASRACQHGNSHVLLEAMPHPSDTLYNYQKGKFVMAEPAIIPLRSGMSFAEGRREQILETWDAEIAAQGISIVYQRRVERIARDADSAVFTVACADGSSYTARAVILAIGLQGNIRKFGMPGEDLPGVQYTLSDPDEFCGETIIVVGAGDAGIENAVALAARNTVHLLNRGEEFASCKDGNRTLLLATERAGAITLHYSAQVARIEQAKGETPLRFVFNAKDGERAMACHRVIGRLGATPPRKLVESFGVQFSSAAPTALPALSEHYESNIPGLFIVGALGGYPLIKQAMNQGYEVVDTINGIAVEPVDEPILRERLGVWRPAAQVSPLIDRLMRDVPLFAAMTRLQVREVLLESTVRRVPAGDIIFRKNDYTNTFFTLIDGVAMIDLVDDGSGSTPRDAGKSAKGGRVLLSKGQFFGEMGLIGGRRRTATILGADNCVVVETPRRTMLKLISAADTVRALIDQAFVRNALMAYMRLSPQGVAELVEGGIELRRYKAREVMFREGDEADGLYLIRSGSATITRGTGDAASFLAYVPAGDYFGEIALLDSSPRSATATANVASEVLVLHRAGVQRRLAAGTQFAGGMRQTMLARTEQNILAEVGGAIPQRDIDPLLREGLGEATNVLVIDENLCIQCNNCEVACAETHGGVSRMQRAAGATVARAHIPVACRHCEHPHCMKECPPNAIARGPDGEVFINETCIGCGNCERNCPYGVIKMVPEKRAKLGGGLLWLLFGLGAAPGQRAPDYAADVKKKAVKCDLCMNLKGGPACVRSCPTGAAIRMSPESLFRQLGPGGQ
ncbi:MAG: cyclic nucleotide-binding domain-containing protein [Gammaproteobacteria bacterium]